MRKEHLDNLTLTRYTEGDSKLPTRYVFDIDRGTSIDKATEGS